MPEFKLKIAIVVHGRFHAFDLARALLQRGHEVTLFTNYPQWAVRRFGVPPSHVRSFVLHAILSRLAWWLKEWVHLPYPESLIHTLFGRWAALQLKREKWDIVHCWSGVSEEGLKAIKGSGAERVLMRGSAHIRTQARLLEEEEKRTRMRVDHPSPWMIAREEREYALADRILVLSHFSHKTFVEEGIPRQKLEILPLGASLEAFRPPPGAVEERCRRLITQEPLRILYVGTFSFRKGMWDVAQVVQKMDRKRFQFHFVGPIALEARELVKTIRPLATFIPPQPQAQLSIFYAWGDLYLGPSIEDGFQTVLGQAAMAALPILTTSHGAGADVVREGETGWLLPIRDPKAIMSRLQWCDEHRQELARMVRRIYEDRKPRSWSDVARDFEELFRHHST